MEKNAIANTAPEVMNQDTGALIISVKDSTEKIINTKEKMKIFLTAINDLDQSNSECVYSKDCYEKLKSREQEYIGTILEKKYWDSLSILLTHIAQREAIFDNNVIGTRKHFIKALEAAKKGSTSGWIKYIEGSLFYLDNNIKGIEGVMYGAENTEVLNRFVVGLQKRGEHYYKEDYLPSEILNKIEEKPLN